MILLAAIVAGAAAEGSITPSQFLFVGGTIAVALIGGLGVIITKRLREPTRIESLWTRLDEQDAKIQAQNSKLEAQNTKLDRAMRRADAAVGVVRDLVRQWPHGHIPRLNPVDLEELDDDDAIPAEWKVKP